MIKKNRKMSTCDQLDMETLGSRSVMPKNLPRHCIWYQIIWLFYCIGIPYFSHFLILTTFFPLLRPVVGIKLHEAKKNDDDDRHLATLNLIMPQKFQDVNAKAIGWWGYVAPRTTLRPLHTHTKSRDHEIVRAHKKVSKGRRNTPPKSCSVVTDTQV